MDRGNRTDELGNLTQFKLTQFKQGDTMTITKEQFFSEYVIPRVENPESMEDYCYEVRGQQYSELKEWADNGGAIATYSEHDGVLMADPGWHLVNRLGYFKLRKPLPEPVVLYDNEDEKKAISLQVKFEFNGPLDEEQRERFMAALKQGVNDAIDRAHQSAGLTRDDFEYEEHDPGIEGWEVSEVE